MLPDVAERLRWLDGDDEAGPFIACVDRHTPRPTVEAYFDDKEGP
jgi:hypothetical protein